MAGLPSPLIVGTIVFAILGFLFSCVGAYLRRSKTFTKDDSQVWCVSVIIGTICCWLMLMLNHGVNWTSRSTCRPA